MPTDTATSAGAYDFREGPIEVAGECEVLAVPAEYGGGDWFNDATSAMGWCTQSTGGTCCERAAHCHTGVTALLCVNDLAGGAGVRCRHWRDCQRRDEGMVRTGFTSGSRNAEVDATAVSLVSSPLRTVVSAADVELSAARDVSEQGPSPKGIETQKIRGKNRTGERRGIKVGSTSRGERRIRAGRLRRSRLAPRRAQ